VRAAVLGSPIAHSLSPALHRAAYAHLGLAWTYEAVECDRARLPSFVASLGPEWAGLSLTMPLKAAVLPLLDEVDPVAERTGAANTVVLRSGRRLGSNTDVPGMVAALAERGVRPTGSAAVLGSGATARSTVFALAHAGWRDITVYARNPPPPGWLESALPPELASAGVQLEAYTLEYAYVAAALRSDLVVSTLPAGVADPFVDRVLGGLGTLFDVVYHPWPTALARAWSERGGTVLGGLDLLVHQAALQVVLMTGTAASADELVAVMRPAGQAELDSRAG
jgi:shikimate dehydrogenase